MSPSGNSSMANGGSYGDPAGGTTRLATGVACLTAVVIPRSIRPV